MIVKTLRSLEPMNVESIPKFTRPAAKLWAKVPAHAKKLLLSNVWCVRCSHSVNSSTLVLLSVGMSWLTGASAYCVKMAQPEVGANSFIQCGLSLNG